ncbi:MAG TPA: M48 family metallopeptidase, partial [Terricaulis sp.]|nr:M48 family metallopeptidase [Terricaulis sp.]
MRLIALAACAALFATAGAAHAAALPFNPEDATRAWLATMGAEATAKSNSYFEGGYVIGVVSTLVSVGVAALFLLLGWAKGVRAWLERKVKFFPLVALGTSFFYILVSSLLTFPLSYYVGFVREHRFDLSTQTLPQWLSEQATGLALGLVLGSIFLTLLYLIVRAAKNTWWVWGSGVAIVFAAVMSMLFPVFIAPMFNTYTPMAESELRDDILAMAQANGVPATDVMVYDRSRQTNSISANVSGFGPTTRISLADTLLERGSPEAVKAVMAHEIGHYVLRHNVSGLIFSAMLILFSFAMVHFSFRALAKNERWGIRDIADPAGLPLIMGILAVLGIVTGPLQNNLVRYNELQADMFGLNTAREPDGFAEAALMLSEYRKMEPGGLEELIFYTHPSGWTRIHNSMVWKAHEIASGRLEP